MVRKGDIKFLHEKHRPTDVSGLRPSMTREGKATLASSALLPGPAVAGTRVGRLECQDALLV